MTKWIVEVQSLVPAGQLAEFLVVAKMDEDTGRCFVVEATFMEARGGSFQIPPEISPFAAVGCAVGADYGINALLQAFMDCAWKRGLRPSKSNLSAGELAAVAAHLEDIRRTGFSKPVEDVTSDTGGDEKKVW